MDFIIQFRDIYMQNNNEAQAPCKKQDTVLLPPGDQEMVQQSGQTFIKIQLDEQLFPPVRQFEAYVRGPSTRAPEKLSLLLMTSDTLQQYCEVGGLEDCFENWRITNDNNKFFLMLQYARTVLFEKYPIFINDLTQKLHFRYGELSQQFSPGNLLTLQPPQMPNQDSVELQYALIAIRSFTQGSIDHAVHIMFFNRNPIEQMEMLRTIQEQIQEVNRIFRPDQLKKSLRPTSTSPDRSESLVRNGSKEGSSSVANKSGEGNQAKSVSQQDYYPFGRYINDQNSGFRVGELQAPNPLKLIVENERKFGKVNLFPANSEFPFNLYVESLLLIEEERSL